MQLDSSLKSLLYLTETIGWLMFIYLGGAGAYELLGGRRVRAAILQWLRFAKIAGVDRAWRRQIQGNLRLSMFGEGSKEKSTA